MCEIGSQITFYAPVQVTPVITASQLNLFFSVEIFDGAENSPALLVFFKTNTIPSTGCGQSWLHASKLQLVGTSYVLRTCSKVRSTFLPNFKSFSRTHNNWLKDPTYSGLRTAQNQGLKGRSLPVLKRGAFFCGGKYFAEQQLLNTHEAQVARWAPMVQSRACTTRLPNRQ